MKKKFHVFRHFRQKSDTSRHFKDKFYTSRHFKQKTDILQSFEQKTDVLQRFRKLFDALHRFRGKTLCVICTMFALSLLLSGCASQRAYQDYMDTAAAAMTQGDYAAVITSCDAAAELFPERTEPFILRADAYAAISALSERYSDTYSEAQRNAIDSYAAVVRVEPGDLQTRQKLMRLYFTAGDDAMEMAGYEDAGVSAAAYAAAEQNYRLALSLDYANVEAYERLADVFLAQGEREKAMELLSRGASVSGGEVLTARLEELRREDTEKEVQRRHTAAVQTLSTPENDQSSRRAYYGSIWNCQMTVEQARAYAQLIADGITGKFHGLSAYGKPVYDTPVYWDEPYAVMGYGSYETDRANVMLADFAGDGNPYLYIYSSLTDGHSFEIYGWDGMKAVLTAGVENYGSGGDGTLSERADGTVVLVESWPEDAVSKSGRVLRFHNGSSVTAQIWQETWDNDTQRVRVVRDGISSQYTSAEWENIKPANAGQHRVPWTSLTEVTAHPSTLRGMMECLNAYAAALSDGAAENVEIPPVHENRHRMASAMLHQLYVLEHLSIDSDIRIREVRLADLDADGTEELLTVFSGTYDSPDGTRCEFALYRWQNGSLVEIPGADELRELRLVRRNTTGEYGFLGIGKNTDPAAYTYVFASESERFLVSPSEGKFYTVRSGEAVGITESEYAALREQYDEVETVADFTRTEESWNYTQIISALCRIRDSFP